MFCVLEDHKYAFVLKYDLDKVDDIWMIQLGAECHFTTSRLRYSRVLYDLTLLVRLEPRRYSTRGSTTTGTVSCLTS